ncbi:hypothetical protein CYMTET_23347 [Cymbomonas tetramitiformis]|uniref:PiggyBac transposable element-derived protein domain-containing protein n=1 Tax=Cymbomonas tetramitiformis TaxID=36881 RepID=A0AAE0FY32_9CHLO|nr:hypothetical protein CYMTET_23347 [Cymbomonas tetramitiformis]
MGFGELLVGRQLSVPAAGACGRDWATSEFKDVCDDPLTYELHAEVLKYDPEAAVGKRFTITFVYDDSTYLKDEAFLLKYLVGSPPERPQTSRAIVLHSTLEPAAERSDSVPLRARPRAANRRSSRATQELALAAEAESEDDDPLEDDDPDREPEEASAGEVANVAARELFLGKYALQWEEGGVAFDQRTLSGFDTDDPKIRWDRVANVDQSLLNTTVLKYFCLFFPVVILSWWCEDITIAGRAKYGKSFISGNRDFTPGLFLIFVANFFYMAVNPGLQRSAYFEETAEFPYVAHNLQRFGLTRHDFGHIIEFLELPTYSRTFPFKKEDLFKRDCGSPAGLPAVDVVVKVRRFIDIWNAWIQHCYKCSHLLNPDETMIRWISKYCLPAFMFVRRKPDPCGQELKSVSDVVTRVMIFVELQEGKTRDAVKDYVKEYGATTAFVLRLIDTLEIGGLGKVLTMDSWFGSVKAAILCLEKGTFIVGLVKTNTKGYPLAQLRDLAENIDKTTHSTRAVSMLAEVKLDIGKRNIYACYHKGPAQSILPLIATCATTIPGANRAYDAHQKLSSGERAAATRDSVDNVCFLSVIPGHRAQRCTVPDCSKLAYSMCALCHTAQVPAWLCGSKTGRPCFQKHVSRRQEKNKNFTPARKRKKPSLGQSAVAEHSEKSQALHHARQLQSAAEAIVAMWE